jgi:hypothetical protein
VRPASIPSSAFLQDPHTHLHVVYTLTNLTGPSIIIHHLRKIYSSRILLMEKNTFERNLIDILLFPITANTFLKIILETRNIISCVFKSVLEQKGCTNLKSLQSYVVFFTRGLKYVLFFINLASIIVTQTRWITHYRYKKNVTHLLKKS